MAAMDAPKCRRHARVNHLCPPPFTYHTAQLPNHLPGSWRYVLSLLPHGVGEKEPLGQLWLPGEAGWKRWKLQGGRQQGWRGQSAKVTTVPTLPPPRQGQVFHRSKIPALPKLGCAGNGTRGWIIHPPSSLELSLRQPGWALVAPYEVRGGQRQLTPRATRKSRTG